MKTKGMYKMFCEIHNLGVHEKKLTQKIEKNIRN